jgi:hypothetical protein
MKFLKKIRKELEKWLNIPHIIKLNKELNKEVIALNNEKDELNRQLTFVTNNEHKRTEEVIKLKKELESKKEVNK